MDARDARREAQDLVGPDHHALVLEPSPPAVTEGPWFADDPVAAPAAIDRAIVSPVGGGDLTWDDWLADHPGQRSWVSRRWLGGDRHVTEPPAGLSQARLGLHRLAAYVLSPARRRANSKIALRWTLGGFGTPFFGDDEQVRVEGNELVRQHKGTVARAPITTLAGAADFLGTVANSDQAEHDTIPLGDLDRLLSARADVGWFLGDWFGFAASILEETRLIGVAADDDVSRVQIWPGHFDAAIEIGSLDAGRRATYGVSPGDPDHDEPYLYVAGWGEIDRANQYWNDKHFNGGSLAYQELLDAPDERAAALEFFRTGYRILAG